MSTLTIHTPSGMFGAEPNEHPLITALRTIGKAFGGPDEWAEKYGTNVDNDVFMMHQYCWCERSDCPWCLDCDCGGDGDGDCLPTCPSLQERAPNFHFKPLDFRVTWYKYIGRGMTTNRGLSLSEIEGMVATCLAMKSIGVQGER